MSPEIDERLTASVGQKLRLRPDEWKSGEVIWIVDFGGDPHATENALHQLLMTTFKNQREKLAIIELHGTSRVAILNELLGLNINENLQPRAR